MDMIKSAIHANALDLIIVCCLAFDLVASTDAIVYYLTLRRKVADESLTIAHIS